VYSLDAPCDLFGQIYPLGGGIFSLYCDEDLRSGGYAVQTGTNGERLVTIDMMGAITYSVTDYLQSCTMYNDKRTEWVGARTRIYAGV